jgi:hypothetical protein
MNLPISSAVLFFLFVTQAALAGSLDQGPGNLAMRADALAKAYQDNEFQADAKYSGKRMSLGGSVVRVGKDNDLGIPYVILRGSGSLNVKCVFAASEMGRLFQLRPGSLVGITGTMTGKRSERSGYLILQDCRI